MYTLIWLLGKKGKFKVCFSLTLFFITYCVTASLKYTVDDHVLFAVHCIAINDLTDNLFARKEALLFSTGHVYMFYIVMTYSQGFHNVILAKFYNRLR